MITLENIGKRFQDHWIFKKVNYRFTTENSYAVLGVNGAGKSTLLRIIAGIQAQSQGKIHYEFSGKNIPSDEIFKHAAYCAPSMLLIEEMTLREFLKFHFTFKKIKKGITEVQIIDTLNMQKDANKLITAFSSGMKQRVKLAQAFYSDVPILILDEPCTNLDTSGIELYDFWLQQAQSEKKLIIIASNDPREYKNVTTAFSMENFKS